ncbi:S8 family serine peptidase [Streptomyces sp. NPDC047081]|uniref:S8 family serine peptidase n=1 Tax=Streptomyces sp. NPDC047081 TaxID=3154706 RepID=UPI0033F72D72
MAQSADKRLPEVVYAHASPRSIGPVSLFDAQNITVDNALQFVSDPDAVRRAKAAFKDWGFRILGESATTIHIAARPELYERHFETKLFTQQREVIPPSGVLPRVMRTFINSPSSGRPGLIATDSGPAAEFLEGVALEQPAIPMSTSAQEPDPGYWALTLDQVAEHLGAQALHAERVTGVGVRLTMVDTGWERHPYFVDKGYNGTVVLGPAATTVDVDEDGHGTCESANAFAVAPGIDFTMVKAGPNNLKGAFDAAVAQSDRPDIISISLGYNAPYPPLPAPAQALASSIALAVRSGIVVVCASGNGHHAFPGQHPDVISAGGVYLDEEWKPQASDYASGFDSGVYPGRKVPDVSGLVGMQPGAAYIVLPAPPGSDIDRRRSQPDEDRDGILDWPGDGTPPDDGWVVASGTSAAAPQIAGVCALLKQACPSLSPAEIREALENSARDVETGVSNPVTGGKAGKGPDNATGYGLVSAVDALRYLEKQGKRA